MKKIYMKPELIAQNLNIECVLQRTSIGIHGNDGSGNTTIPPDIDDPTIEVGAKDFYNSNAWDDED